MGATRGPRTGWKLHRLLGQDGSYPGSEDRMEATRGPRTGRELPGLLGQDGSYPGS